MTVRQADSPTLGEELHRSEYLVNSVGGDVGKRNFQRELDAVFSEKVRAKINRNFLLDFH